MQQPRPQAQAQAQAEEMAPLQQALVPQQPSCLALVQDRSQGWPECPAKDLLVCPTPPKRRLLASLDAGLAWVLSFEFSMADRCQRLLGSLCLSKSPLMVQKL